MIDRIASKGSAFQDARRWWLVLPLICAAQFMIVLDLTIVNVVALPSIQQALGFSQVALQWVVTAYALTFGGFLLLGDRAADLLGRRRFFMAGLALLTAASLAAGLAPTGWVLIAARALQGLGAAVVAPAALSLITTTFAESRERNRALGVFGGIVSTGFAVGVLLGGVLTQTFSWEWVFFVNVPVGALAFALAPALIAESRAQEESAMEPGGPEEAARHPRQTAGRYAGLAGGAGLLRASAQFTTARPVQCPLSRSSSQSSNGTVHLEPLPYNFPEIMR